MFTFLCQLSGFEKHAPTYRNRNSDLWQQIHANYGENIFFLEQGASWTECYTSVVFYHFFLRAFDRREQAVFFSNQDPHVHSKCFQHFRPRSVFCSKQCSTIGVNNRAEQFMLSLESPCSHLHMRLEFVSLDLVSSEENTALRHGDFY